MTSTFDEASVIEEVAENKWRFFVSFSQYVQCWVITLEWMCHFTTTMEAPMRCSVISTIKIS